MIKKTREEVRAKISPALSPSGRTRPDHTPRSLFLARLLLTGKAWNRVQLFDAIVNAYPNGSPNHTAAVLYQTLPFARDLNIFEHVGKDSIRIKPKLLALLKEEDE